MGHAHAQDTTGQCPPNFGIRRPIVGTPLPNGTVVWRRGMTVLILHVAIGVALGIVLAGLILLGVLFAIGTINFTARPAHCAHGNKTNERRET